VCVYVCMCARMYVCACVYVHACDMLARIKKRVIWCQDRTRVFMATGFLFDERNANE
jgi:hypothetical protein